MAEHVRVEGDLHAPDDAVNSTSGVASARAAPGRSPPPAGPGTWAVAAVPVVRGAAARAVPAATGRAVAPSSSRRSDARVLERPQRVGDVPARPQHLDQRGAGRLAERRGLDRGARGLLGDGQLAAAEPRAADGDDLEQLDPQVGQLGALGVDPVRLQAGQQAARRRSPALPRRRISPSCQRPAGDRRVRLAQAGERRLPVDPRVGRQVQRELTAARQPPRPQRLAQA